MDLSDIVAQSETDDPRQGLRTVVALRRLASRLEALHVQRARRLGLSWAQIAAELDVTKQSVHQKYAGPHSKKEG